jgi:hypothetical protein
MKRTVLAAAAAAAREKNGKIREVAIERRTEES